MLSFSRQLSGTGLFFTSSSSHHFTAHKFAAALCLKNTDKVVMMSSVTLCCRCCRHMLWLNTIIMFLASTRPIAVSRHNVSTVCVSDVKRLPVFRRTDAEGPRESAAASVHHAVPLGGNPPPAAPRGSVVVAQVGFRAF